MLQQFWGRTEDAVPTIPFVTGTFFGTEHVLTSTTTTNSTMGTVSSRGAPSSMPGSLSMDAPNLFPQFAKNDDRVAPEDVIDHPAKSNHTGSPQIDHEPCTGIPPGVIPAAGPVEHTSDAPTIPDPPLHFRAHHAEELLNPSPSSSSCSTPLTPPEPCSVPPPTSTSNMGLHLHSPSSQIVGTPFATNSTRFEYPFPATPHNSTTSMLHFPSPASSSLSVAPPSPGHNPATASLSLSMAFDFSQLSLTHPKMQRNAPPIPPSLLKKRKEKFQNMQGRRSTLDLSTTKVTGHDTVHHTFSDSNLRKNGHGIKA